MNLRNIFIKASTAIAMAGLTVTAASAVDLQATASATVVDPLAIAQDTPMDFGTISGSGTAGTVTLATDGSRTTANGAEIIGTDGVAGSYTITGQGGLLVNIAIANGTLTGPGTDMPVSNFATSLGAPPIVNEPIPAAGPTGNHLGHSGVDPHPDRRSEPHGPF